MSTWEVDPDPDELWEQFQEDYQSGFDHLRIRPAHTPPAIAYKPPVQTDQVQFIGFLQKTKIKYTAYGDVEVGFRIPAQFVGALFEGLIGMSHGLISVDLVAMPPLDFEEDIDAQLDGLEPNWWKKK